MTTEDRSSRRAMFPVVAATTAITLAVGVTVASLSGYLGPRSTPAISGALPSAAASGPEAPVVLVPVTRSAAEPPPAALSPRRDPEPVFAAWVEHDDEEGEPRTRHDQRARHEDD